ncbi:DUF2461 family protein [Mycolicibacterium sarraceniae]|uniref:Uncharacterized protein n=1 Tax=Mycolicibacterium sarraceniae TaxID=1534348 RepID=A0A7I7SP67_9MYCO|nr:DUF2461 family protein [Mycolicibacterium sarraceniae]BBY57825.1 hypothetical protein MSAR_09610 [Mycolicibacterium sarraceniae]
MGFRGWPIEAVEFHEGLAADNSTAYWSEHSGVYDRQVKGPMEELLAELADEFGTDRLFGPHRDAAALTRHTGIRQWLSRHVC